MALLTYDLHIDAGATFNVSFVYTNADGTVYPLTGYTASMQIRPSATSTTLSASVTPTITVATGQIDVVIPAATTSTLTSSPYVWALELKAPTADPVIRFAEGRVIVSPEVVR